MSKQWGHGFHSGREQIITDMIKALNSQIPESELSTASIYLRQAGGKYCTFECPVCNKPNQLYKMTANSGWCDGCGSAFHNFEAKYEITPDKDMDFNDFIGFVEIESPPHHETWEDYRKQCLAIYSGGHHDDEMLDAFQHGMNTVFNFLVTRFPSPKEIFDNRKIKR